MSSYRTVVPTGDGKEGGQGTVHEVVGSSGVVVKLYHDWTSDLEDELEAVIGWRLGLTSRDRLVLDKRTAWPLELARTSDGRVGFLMPRVPDQLRRRDGGLLEIQFAYSRAGRWGGVEPPSLRQVVGLCADLAGVLRLMHRNGVAFGDISHTNVLYSNRARPHVFLLDCDSVWITSRPRKATIETITWHDRCGGGDTPERAIAADIFKLALVFVRMYYRSSVTITAATRSFSLPESPPVSMPVAELLTRSLHEDSSRRPDADEWVDALSGLWRALRHRGL